MSGSTLKRKENFMSKLISKSELETQKSDHKNTHYVGEIYPQIFSYSEKFEFKDDMPLQTAILYLGSYQLENNLFPKQKCPCNLTYRTRLN